jgi:pimeloyl-ACP methyl ester carboxylesterase
LVIAGLDDPIVPLANARILHRLLPNSTLHLHAGGHIDLVANAAELGPVIEMFRKRQLRKTP